MTRLPLILFTVLLVACEPMMDQEFPLPAERYTYMDVHEFGPGKVTAAMMAQARAADLTVQDRFGVQFLQYWVDELQGKVYCLSRAPNADAVYATHLHAHGLLPATVGQVTDGR